MLSSNKIIQDKDKDRLISIKNLKSTNQSQHLTKELKEIKKKNKNKQYDVWGEAKGISAKKTLRYWGDTCRPQNESHSLEEGKWEARSWKESF